jgi:hypothetical protein
MKKEIVKNTEPVEVNEAEELLAHIVSELASSEDFILTYIKTLCIVNGGKFNLDELRAKYNWRLAKVQALSSAINHFAARGLVKRGATTSDCSLV